MYRIEIYAPMSGDGGLAFRTSFECSYYSGIAMAIIEGKPPGWEIRIVRDWEPGHPVEITYRVDESGTIVTTR